MRDAHPIRRVLAFLGRHALALLLLGFFAAFLIYPIVYVIPASAHFQETVFENGKPVIVDGQPLKRDVWSSFFFLSLLQNDFLWACLRNSLLIATLATLFTTFISLPLAYWFTRRRFRGQTLLAGLLLAPLILPPFVGALGLERFLNPYGTLNLWLIDLGLMDGRQPIDWLGRGGLFGIVLMEVLHLYPIMYLNVAASLANVDPTMEEAARNLGAGEWRVFRTVTFPLMLPGYFAGATIVFVWAFTDLGTPLVFNYSKVIPVQIFNQISERETNPLGYALVVVTLLITAVLFYGARFLVGRGDYVMMSKGGIGSAARPVGFLQTLLIWLAVGLLTFVAVIPHLGVVLMSISARWLLTPLPTDVTFDNFRLVLDERIAFLSIKNSLQYSLASTALDVVLGVAIAYLVVRRPSRLTPLLDGLAMLPLALPGLVLAFGYLTCYNRLSLFGWEFGRLLDPARNPTLLLVIAYTVRRLPYVTRAALAGLQQTPVVMEEAAENLGAGRWRVFRTVTLPLLSANLLAGAILTFAFALLEVSDSLMLAQQEKYMPITRAIFGFWTRPDDGPYIASAMGVLGMAILLVSMLAASVVLGRKMGELFRA
jgi:iron(III) transport system permease protein